MGENLSPLLFVGTMTHYRAMSFYRANIDSPLRFTVKFIGCPLCWVIDDIIRNILARFVITDDNVVIITLPNGMDIGALSKPFCNANFEPTNNRVDCF
jgi:hypothetical protein